MSTEQRDKAAMENASISPIDFIAGWGAHAATMPDREVLATVIDAVVALPLTLRLDLADAILTLLNKEGEE